MAQKEDIPGKEKMTVDIAIRQAPEVCYRFWRNFKNLPHCMSHLDSVEEIDRLRSHWIVEGPADTTLEWDAEILEDVPNKKIRWHSLKGAEMDNEGSVSFVPRKDGGTQLKVVLTYRMPLGKLGDAFARLFGESPEKQLEDDLEGFKSMIEKSPSGRVEEV